MDLLVEHDLSELAEVYFRFINSTWHRTMEGLITLAYSDGVEFGPEKAHGDTDSDDERWNGSYYDDGWDSESSDG